jgi:nucleotide-binding universal stress UspA family protein
MRVLWSMKKILVPVDLSSVTTQVARTACDLAKKSHAEVVLLHAVQPPPVIASDHYGIAAEQFSSLISSAEAIADRKLRQLARRCAKRVPKVKALRAGGPAVAVITRKARGLKPAYIVMGSHGHGAVYDLLMGSTTHGVLRQARCPVLVVPSRGKARR